MAQEMVQSSSNAKSTIEGQRSNWLRDRREFIALFLEPNIRAVSLSLE